MSQKMEVSRRALLAGATAALILPKTRPAAAQAPASAGVTRLWNGLALQDSAGNRFHLADLKGRTKLVKLWANWCAGCLQELPSLRATADAIGPDALEIVFISHPEFFRQDIHMAQRLRIPFRLATLAPDNPESAVKAALLDNQGAYVVPRALLFRGAEPTLAWSHLGYRDWTGASQELRG